MNANFKIALSRDDFSKLDRESVPEYIKNSWNEMVLKRTKLTGTWISKIAAKINEYEGHNYAIIGKNGRINRVKKQETAKFYNATGK